MSESRYIVLSRYFNSNVQFVARKSAKYYEKCDVKIVSINLAFIRQFDKKIADEIFGRDSSLKKKCKHRLRYKIPGKNSISTSNRVATRSKAKKRKKIFKSSNVFEVISDIKKSVASQEENLEYVEISSVLPSTKTVRSCQKYCNEVLQEDYLKTAVQICSTSDLKSPYNSSGMNWNVNKIITSSNSVRQKHRIKDLQAEYLLNVGERLSTFESSIWVPPHSPHNLIEEVLHHDPWALLVATIFLNKTNCTTARHHLFRFLLDHRGPADVLDRFPRDLEVYFVGLGLQRTRAVQVYRMSYDFLFKKWTNVKELYGVGHYGDCAFRMFCLGDFDVEPKDRYLRIYKGWYEKVYMCERLD